MNAQQLISKLKQNPLATVCGIISVFLIAAIVLRGGALSEAKIRYDTVQQEVSDMEANVKNAYGLEKDVREIDALVEDVNSRLLNEGARADHYRYFLSLSEQSGANLSDPSLNDYLAAGSKGVKMVTRELSQVEFSLSVQGDFQQVMDFIYLLTSSQYFVRIDQLSLGQIGGESGEGASARLIIRILAQSPPKPEKK